MKILVTGYKGFIGQNMCNYLVGQGHDVEGWDYVENCVPDPSGYDWVIHLGAITSTTYTDVDQIMEQNFEYSMKILQVCENYGTNFQYASSASVYGPTTHFTEDGPLLPQSPYAWSKYLFDRFVNQHKDDFNVIVQGFRYFNVYGSHEGEKGDQASPYTKFRIQAQQDNVINVFEDSEHYKRDFVCVEDICKVHEKMLTVDASNIYNVGTGNPESFDTVAQTIAKKYNAAINYIPIPDNVKNQYQEYTCANLDKLNSVIDMEWINIKDYINDH
jgi:ADP-L-glycero-D-manno-heptose 6-epimerase|tara:strand:+ start:1106 stop:1924 length:819 start_codon:yes stop_codon:yes gene_type:complete